MSTPRFSEEDAPKKLPGLQPNSDGLLSEYEAEYAGAESDDSEKDNSKNELERSTDRESCSTAAEKQERHAEDALETDALVPRESSTDKSAASAVREEEELLTKKKD